jgi:hypothetical protein
LEGGVGEIRKTSMRLKVEKFALIICEIYEARRKGTRKNERNKFFGDCKCCGFLGAQKNDGNLIFHALALCITLPVTKKGKKKNSWNG